MTVAVWNLAPKRLWKRISVYVRPDIHAAAEEHRENFTLLLNNALACKYDLEPCVEGGVYPASRLRLLNETNAALEREIAVLTSELSRDRTVPELKVELERQRAKAVALREERHREEAASASRLDDVRHALDALIGDAPPSRYARMLPENDFHGDLADGLDRLVAEVSHRCGFAVNPSEVVAELRRRCLEEGRGP